MRYRNDVIDRAVSNNAAGKLLMASATMNLFLMTSFARQPVYDSLWLFISIGSDQNANRADAGGFSLKVTEPLNRGHGSFTGRRVCIN